MDERLRSAGFCSVSICSWALVYYLKRYTVLDLVLCEQGVLGPGERLDELAHQLLGKQTMQARRMCQI